MGRVPAPRPNRRSPHPKRCRRPRRFLAWITGARLIARGLRHPGLPTEAPFFPKARPPRANARPYFRRPRTGNPVTASRDGGRRCSSAPVFPSGSASGCFVRLPPLPSSTPSRPPHDSARPAAIMGGVLCITTRSGISAVVQALLALHRGSFWSSASSTTADCRRRASRPLPVRLRSPERGRRARSRAAERTGFPAQIHCMPDNLRMAVSQGESSFWSAVAAAEIALPSPHSSAT